MMLIHPGFSFILLSLSSIVVHCTKSDGVTSQPLPALQTVNSSFSSIPIIEAKSVKVIKNVSNYDVNKAPPGKVSLVSPSSQVNSKRFGDLRLTSLLWSKKIADPKFGFPALDHQLAGSSPIQVSSLPGRTLSWNDQSGSSSMSGSSPLHLSRLRGILPSLRLKDVLGKGNHQSMLQLTPSESSQVVVSSSAIDTGSGGISPSLGSSSPLTGSSGLGGGVSSNSDLGLSAVSSQLGNGLLMNQPQGTSSTGGSSSSSSSSIPSSLTPDQVSKLTASFEHGFNQQVHQQMLASHFQQQQAQTAQTSSEVGGTSSIFRKLVSSGRSRIPRLPSLLHRPASSSSLGVVNPLISSPSSSPSLGGAQTVDGIVTKGNHISLHKLIPFLWPYKLSPPNPGSPIPSPPTSKLRGFFKPKFFKSLDQPQIDQQAQDQQPMPVYLVHPDYVKHHTHSSATTSHLHPHHSETVASSSSLFVTKQPETGGINGNSPNAEQTSTNIQFKPHLHFIEGHEQPAQDDDDQYPKDNEPILPSQPEESSSVQIDGSSSEKQKDEQQQNSKLQLDAVRAITSLLQGQQNKQQSSNNQKNIIQFQIQEQESDPPKTYHEYLMQQQKQHELIESAKSEALEAAKNYALKSGQSKIAIKPVKLIQLVLNGKKNNEQLLNVGQQYLQQTFNDISATSPGSTEESRNMPVVYSGIQQLVQNQPRRLRRPIRPPQPPPGYQEHLEGTGSQNSEIQFVRLPVQESGENNGEYAQPNVPVSDSEHQQQMFQHQQNELIQFQQGLSQQQQMLISALESAPQPPLPPNVGFRPEVTFIQRPSATVAFFPPTLSAPPGYHGLDTSQSAHHSSVQGSHNPTNIDQMLGQYEYVGQQPAPQIPVHLLMQQQFGQLPPHLIQHQAHIAHQLHPHHPGGRVVKTVLIKEQLEHINPGQPVHHQQPHLSNSPNSPARAPITGYGMHGWIPKDVPNDWTPGGPFRSATHSYNDEIKFSPFDRMTTKSPSDVVQINHHWYPSSERTIQGLTSTPVTEKPSVPKPTESEPATSAIAEQPKDEEHHEEDGVEESLPKDLATESSVKHTKPASPIPVPPTVSDKYVNQRQYIKPRPVNRVTLHTSTTSTTTTTEAPDFKEEDVHVVIVEDPEQPKSSVEALKESSSGVAIEVIPSTKRHLFERIGSTTTVVPSTTITTTTTTPRPITSTTTVATSTTVVETSTKKDKISRRNSNPSIVLSSIDIELGPKGSPQRSSAESFLANLDKKVGLLKDAKIAWD